MSAATLIDLPRLVDLALGTPDSGAVNFNVLHALLHSIVHLLNVGNVRIELTDISICKPEPPATAIKGGAKLTVVEEYKLEGGKKVPIKKSSRDVEKVIRVQKSGKEGTIAEIAIPSAPATIKEPEKSKASTVAEKQQKSGKQQDIVSQGQTQGPSVVNMEEILNIAKRMDQSDNRTNSMEKTLKDLWNKYENLNKILQEMSKGIKGGKIDNIEMDRRDELAKSKVQDQGYRDTSTEKAGKSGKAYNEPVAEQNIVSKIEPYIEPCTEEGNKSQQFYDNKQITAIEEEVRNIKSDIDEIKKQLQISDKEGEEETEKSSTKSKDDLECSSSFEITPEKECNYLIKKLNHKFDLLASKSLTMNDRILDIEKDLCELNDQLESLIVLKDGKTSQLTIVDIMNELCDVKLYIMENIKNFKAKIAEYGDINSNINAINDAIKKLTISKIDKNDFEELLSEKVDYNMLQRKVSVDQFDATKRDLESFMVNTLRKIEERDNDWCKTIALFKKELELKLNAVEITGLRQYFEKRIHAVQDNIFALHSERKDAEAAGTRSKMLRDLCCISCNRCVLMRSEEENKVPQLKPMSVRKSLKPFLTYELDNIRKQMRMPGKNLRHLEAIYKDTNIVDSTAKQICNRYCGGSHTIITAEDRIKRGRSGRLSGTDGKPPICKCMEPEPPVCTCPDEEEATDVCPCPVETEICECPSDDDHLEKCASARRKRCAEIDRQRRQICKEEIERKRQKEPCDDGEGDKDQRKHYRSCKDPRRKRRPCIYQNDTDVGEHCQAQLAQYQKCIDAARYDTYSTNIKRESLVDSFTDVNSIKLQSKNSANYAKSVDEKEQEHQEELPKEKKPSEIDAVQLPENVIDTPVADVVEDQDTVKGREEDTTKTEPIYDEEQMEEEQEE